LINSGTRTRIGFSAFLIVVCAFAIDASAIALGGATVVLQSQRYYKRWDLTRLVYRVSAKNNELPTHFVLEAGACLENEAFDRWLSTPFEWVVEPFDGLQFDIDSRNQRIYLWLNGPWDVESVDTALVFPETGAVIGKLEGPSCGGSSISLEIADGANVQFPSLLGVGRWEAETGTLLDVSSSQSGWAVDYQLTFSIPEGARHDIVSKIMEVSLSPYSASAGDTSVLVSYALNVVAEDFMGLPEGIYTISIIYTLSGGG